VLECTLEYEEGGKEKLASIIIDISNNYKRYLILTITNSKPQHRYVNVNINTRKKEYFQLLLFTTNLISREHRGFRL